VLALVLLALIATLRGLEFASPPDPVWIAGIYDDADFDDVIAYIMFVSGLVDEFATPDPRPGILPPFSLPDLFDRTVLLYIPAAADPRAPPTVSYSAA